MGILQTNIFPICGIVLHGQRNVETINSKRIEPYEEMERAPL
jgi:hypothetical protein